MYWSFPVTRARPGATVLARHGDPRMQNQYGRHVLLASQLYGPGRTVFIGFDSTYRWRYLAEDHFDGFWARLVDRVGRNQALGGRFPFTVNLGKGVIPGRRAGDHRRPLRRGRRDGRGRGPVRRDRDRRPAARADPVRPGGRGPRPLDRHLPGRPGRGVLAPDRGGDRRPRPARASRRRPPPSASSPPAARSTSRRSTAPCWPTWPGSPAAGSSSWPTSARSTTAIPIREVTRTLENRDELWDAPLALRGSSSWG